MAEPFRFSIKWLLGMVAVACVIARIVAVAFPQWHDIFGVCVFLGSFALMGAAIGTGWDRPGLCALLGLFVGILFLIGVTMLDRATMPARK